MTYQETLTYLFSKLPIFTRIGAAAYKADLQNTILLCKELGHPEKKLKCIHIAGTNGKGSCSHMMSSIFQAAGYKTALYTSPHLIDFRERIKINGIEIGEDDVVSLTEKLIPLTEKIQPSFFEVTVAMAFAYFAEQEVDIAIIETGLGGLLDSTNIITPELSIITNISYDHTNLLGNTLEKIAFQKAGIIKASIPVVIGETHPESEAVFRDMATSQQSNITFADQVFTINEAIHLQDKLNISITNCIHQNTQVIALDLTGDYQVRNIKTVLASLDILRSNGWHLSAENLAEGLSNVKKNTGIKGRFDILHTNPTIITDVAHNEAGLLEVFNQVNQLPHKNLHIITGFVQDKTVEQILKIFPRKATYYFTQADIPRALPYEILTEKAVLLGLQGEGFKTVKDALKQALSDAHTDDIILVTGSFFILADVYDAFDQKN
jgi:dihydrofolate synthase / folylpolyglutamate synthase